MRTRRAVIDLVAAFAVSAIAFAVGVTQIIQSPNEPTFLGIGGLILGIVSFVVACSVFWSFAKGAPREVRITDQGVFYDGTEWPWDSVVRIRCIPMLPRGVVYLSVCVNQGRLRSSLSLPITVAAPEATKIIEELKTYLDSSGYAIRWQQRGV